MSISPVPLPFDRIPAVAGRHVVADIDGEWCRSARRCRCPRIVPVTAPPVVTVTVPVPMVAPYPEGAAGDGAAGGNEHIAAVRFRLDAGA